MAIYHLSTKPVSRSSGRSAVASAAYRCAVLLTNQRDGLVHDFTRKEGVEHKEIVLPEGLSAEWALDRSALWNAAEFAEKRKDARVAREFEIALPHELSPEGRLKAARAFAQDLANRYGAAVDFAIHSPSEHGDTRNYHAHVLMTTRQVGRTRLGEKTYLEHKNARLLANGMATTDMQLRDIRQAWEGIANRQLQHEGLDVRIDHRSHVERGLELSPTGHMGVHASQMQQQGMAVERGRLDDEAARQNAELIRQKPEQVLTLISNEKSVFDRHDIAKTLHRYINDDAHTFRNAFAAVLASPALVKLQAERIDPETGDVSSARYSTREMIDLEFAMAHRRADVRALNAAIRSELQNRQRLERSHGRSAGANRGDGEDRGKSEDGGELTFQTNNGKRAFAAGDRIIFLENNRDLAVKNGMLGTVEHVEPNKIIARLDGRSGDSVSILTDSYQAIDHGYATTIHKNQGATVDRAFVLASGTMDRHLTYVAMTRHRDSVQLYADIKEFTKAGQLVDQGVAPYEHNPKSRESYFVTLENDKGERRTVWGVDLKRAMRDASPEIGDRIELQHEGATPITLPDGTQAERNAWRVVNGDELAYQKLATRLSRSGAKETTLDYISDFAERRGIAEQLGVKSEIELASARGERQEVVSRPAHPVREQQDRPAERQQVEKARAGDMAGPVRRENPRNPVAGDIDDGRRDDRTEDNKGYRRIRCSDLMSKESILPAPTEAVGQQLAPETGKLTPLVPAITRYQRSIEEVAQQRALSVIDQKFDTVESLVRRVFRDPAEVSARLRTAMTEKEGNGKIMAKAMAEQPERFGELRGKSGLFGNSRERKEALQYAGSLSPHIGYVLEAWERRLGEERQSERWQREKRDVIEVPGLTPRSAEIISQVEKMPVERRSKFIKELRSSPEGQAALDEAKLVANALTRRFGSSDPRRFAEELEARAELAKQAEQIQMTARIVNRTHMAELSHDHTLKQQLNRSRGLGLSR
ncbi:MobQ family relaxase [Agrobacterium sp. DE0009]|uniref:MobQ family relaxase n=1 Tax=Agrobacterium sp. DE0009 TaxID=2587505 RepID=UPI0011A3484D|nr:MobQ family relaxase [Agrobacterium sp. DE0009]